MIKNVNILIQIGDLGRKGWGDVAGTNSSEPNYYSAQNNYQSSSNSYHEGLSESAYSTEKSSLVSESNSRYEIKKKKKKKTKQKKKKNLNICLQPN